MKQTISIILLFLSVTSSALGQYSVNGAADSVIRKNENPDSLQRRKGAPIHQLRIYEIPKENQQVFHSRFKEHALRIMKKYGFTIVAIWESESNNKVEFVYLLEWEDVSSMKKAWSDFMADQEWKDIKATTGKKYGKFVNNIQERTLVLTEYSPQKKLLN